MAATKYKRHAKPTYDLYDDLAKIRNAFANTAHDVTGMTGDYLSQSVNDMKEKSLYARDEVADYAAERPFKALGMAFLVGFGIGFLLRNKK